MDNPVFQKEEALLHSYGGSDRGGHYYGSLSSRHEARHTTRETPFMEAEGEVLESDASQEAPSLNIIGLSYVVKERVGHWWTGSCCRSARTKVVLNNLCMTFATGELTALVGTSGSGKTSLLDVISGRSTGVTTGVVSYEGQQCTRKMMRQKSSYVLQADRLLPTLTVRETLTYMAYLKLPGHFKPSDINRKVQTVITDMGLNHVAENRIGGAIVRGVSGGEKRRITIGVQLLKDPDILLLDEPTSGLDAFTAHHLVQSLADLAHKGKLVIMSIHQPRSDIFRLLDKIAILTIGQLAFLGRPDQMVPYFTSVGYSCPVNQNPCDIYIDLTSVDRRTPDQEVKTLKRAKKLCAAFTNNEIYTEILKRITFGLSQYDSEETQGTVERVSKSPSYPRTFNCLLNRMNIHVWRNRGDCLGRFIFLPFFIPFIIMFLGRLGLNQESIQDRLGVIYQASQVPPYMGIVNGVALYPALRDLFYREYQDGLYSTLTFLGVYYVHCLPFNIISSLVFSGILYWSVGLNPDLVSFGCFILVVVMLSQIGEMVTVSIMGVFRNIQLASNATTLIFSASGVVASGLLRTIENMPTVLQWASYIAVHKYSTAILVGNEFHGLKFTCPEQAAEQCMMKGDNFINTYYPHALEHMTRNFIILGGYSTAVFILAFIVMKIRGIPTLH
ncbi:ATP-binding cassette sub-family G member 5-like isoform X1 [Biomphalaria glabrata]|uniref:ATP-binding cassette sub-family G member 5-like isoform X1 n=2 Tax=Biomphalaria glabrata TaxID=6526 RepID=A0A9W2ZW65_BIOGL|nr:ATP-binding cassette sub-family G member 5-like isoform X1 [Biomphalaria glabrata]